MRRYAQDTKVPVERSRTELEQLITKHGAHQILIGTDSEQGLALVQFRIADRNVKMRFEVSQKPQDARRKWRQMLLITKAKLELVADGGSTIEREFLADVMLPNGATVGEALAPQLAGAYKSGKMPPLLGPAGTGT